MECSRSRARASSAQDMHQGGAEMNWKITLRTAVFSAALAGGLLLSVGAGTARADDDMAACHRNIDKWQDRLNHDAERHGNDSRQAMHDRHELDEARDACRHKFADRWHDDDHHDDHDHDNH